MKKIRMFTILTVLTLIFTVSASAMTSVFTSKTVSTGVTVTQTKCVNSLGDKVSTIYYLYNSAGDYSSKTLTGGTSVAPAIGTLTPKAAYVGKTHSLYLEKGSGVTLNYTYTIS